MDRVRRAVRTALLTMAAVVGVVASGARAQSGTDSCAGSPLALPGAIVTGTTVGATPSTLPVGGLCVSNTSSPDVWWTFVSPADGRLDVTTCGSNFDTVISVHSQCPTPTNAFLLGCNDQATFGPCAGTNQSVLSVNVTRGQTVYVRLGGWNGAAGNYTVSFGYGVFSLPPNDACGSATTVTNFLANYDGTTAGASADGNSVCAPNLPDVWYRFVAGGNGTMQVKDCAGFAAGTTLSAFAACGSGANAVEIACRSNPNCSSSGLAFDVVSGREYFVRVTTPTGPGLFTLQFQLSYGFPLNDLCTSPQPIRDGTYYAWTQGTFTSQTPATNGCTDFCGGPNSGRDIFYSFSVTGTCARTVSINTCGSSFDTVLSLHNACPRIGIGCNTIACSDDNPLGGCGASTSSISATLNPGNYIIRVAGYNNLTGNVQLTMSSAPAVPSNANCATPQTVTTGTINFNTCNVTPTVFTCGATFSMNSLFYQYTAATTGVVIVNTCSPNLSSIAVFPAGACGSLGTPTTCGNSQFCGNGSAAAFAAIAGQSYLIRVATFGADTGQLTIINTGENCGPINPDAYRSAVLADGPLGYWRMTQSANGGAIAADEVNRNGVNCGRVPGLHRGPLAFGDSALPNGNANDRSARLGVFDMERTDSMFVGSVDSGSNVTNFTIEAWVKTTVSQAGVVMTNRFTPNNKSLALAVGVSPAGSIPGEAVFTFDGPGAQFGARSFVRVDDGRWHHLVGTRRAVPQQPSGVLYVYSIYVDGVLRGQNNISAGGYPADQSATSTSAWTIGDYPAWAGLYPAKFSGQIDDVALFRQALSDARIQDHYNAAYCVADLDDGSGTGVRDGGVGIEDLLFYLSVYDAGDVRADVDDGSGTGVRDGGIGIEDLLYYLTRYDAGC